MGIVAGIIAIIGMCTLVYALLSSRDVQELISKLVAIVGILILAIGLMGVFAPIIESESYNKGVLDHAAGLVQVDSTWESRITIKKVGE